MGVGTGGFGALRAFLRARVDGEVICGDHFDGGAQADELGEQYGTAAHLAGMVRVARVERRVDVADVLGPFPAHPIYPCTGRSTTKPCGVLEGAAPGEPAGDVGHGAVTGADGRQPEREERRNSALQCVELGDDAKRARRPEVNAEGLGGAVNVAQLELVVGAEGTGVGRAAAVAASRGGVLVPRVILVGEDHGDRRQNRREQDCEQIAHVEHGEHHGERVHVVELVVLAVHVIGHDGLPVE